MKYKFAPTLVFLVGLAAVAWVSWGFVGHNHLALSLCGLIAATYLLGAHELRQYRVATASLDQALTALPATPTDLAAWLQGVHPTLRHPVRLRIEGERTALPGPALTPYLVGLLVMLGMLGTFLGMVVTFKGAVFALEGSADLAAMRAALTEPIKGLGLSFGTSVAGVAASAILGLLSALSRQGRLQAVRQLDAHIGSTLKPYSAAHQRELTFQALQTQAQALPQIADQLGALIDGLMRRTAELEQNLQSRQDRFQAEAASAYQALAREVSTALESSLGRSARLTGEAIVPVINQAMADITQAARLTHQQLIEATQAQLQTMASQWAASAQDVSAGWQTALTQQGHQQDALVQGLDQALQRFNQGFEQQAQQVLHTLQASTTQAHDTLAQRDQARLEAWQTSLQAMAARLADAWQRIGEQSLAQHQAVTVALENASTHITERASEQVRQTLAGVAGLLTQSEALVRTRMQSEAEWVNAQAARMAEISDLWRTELAALRDQEAARADAAVQSLQDLQGAVATHLASLGASLEAPMTRLLQMASDVPQAAAGVISQLRQEMAALSERDNIALDERTQMMAQLGTLLASVNQTTAEQQTAIQTLVQQATDVLAQTHQRFAAQLDAQAGQVDAVAAHVSASAVELAALGDAFSQSVTQFGESNQRLMSSLQGIEAALGQSLSRSDEQLAYYVAQAREVIDLSISAQQGIIDELRRLPAQAAAAGGA
jgi:hypothetical protein